eukprot:4456809-Alexandrium_andersonii.AAC.1
MQAETTQRASRVRTPLRRRGPSPPPWPVPRSSRGPWGTPEPVALPRDCSACTRSLWLKELDVRGFRWQA